MSGWERNPLLNAGALVFPPPSAPPGHTPTFRTPSHLTLEIPRGMAYCLGCGQIVDAKQWAEERCPGLRDHEPHA